VTARPVKNRVSAALPSAGSGRHSAKIFFLFLISLPSAPDLALGKDFFLFFLNSLPSVSDLALGKEKFFIFKILCRVLPGRHSAKI